MVNENECLWNNRMTDYRDTKKKEPLWQAKAEEMQYPGKRNRFHFSDVHGSMNTMGHVQSKWCFNVNFVRDPLCSYFHEFQKNWN